VTARKAELREILAKIQENQKKLEELSKNG
jgi:hypothetical protein